MRKVRALGICASPRVGNSSFLLQRAIEGAKSVEHTAVEWELYSLRGKTFQPCLACSYCAEHDGACVREDDFQELRDKWLEADVIIYSVPVYHMGLPGQLKCFIDRLGNTMFSSFRSSLPEGRDTLPKLLKIIGCIVQGVHIFAGQEHAMTDLINHAIVMQSIPVAGDVWESYIGCAGWTQNDMATDGLEKQALAGDLCSSATVRAAQSLGRRCVEMAVIVKAGVLSFRDTMQKDPLYRPLLDRWEAI